MLPAYFFFVPLGDNALQEPDIQFEGNGYWDTAYCDWCLGQTVQALIDDGQEELAAVLLACKLIWKMANNDNPDNSIRVTVHGPMSAVKVIRHSEIAYDAAGRITNMKDNEEAFKAALQLVLGPDIAINECGYRVETTSLPPNWREELLEIARKKGTTNQGRTFSSDVRPPLQYANLNFRSESEIRIAKAFDAKGVLYFANCTARVNKGGERANREPDFLICQDGKWGILEVDGDAFHPPSNVAQDHERDRLFGWHGVKFIQHYPATRCYQEPVQVVTDFLELLGKNG